MAIGLCTAISNPLQKMMYKKYDFHQALKKYLCTNEQTHCLQIIFFDFIDRHYIEFVCKVGKNY
jgi:hypothetical protein